MAESKQYLLGNERYVTVNINKSASEIYKINSDGTRTIYADYDNGTITPSTFSSEDFRRNLAQGTYKNTINTSVNDAQGIPPAQVADENQPSVTSGSTPTNPNVSQPTQQATPQSLRYPKIMGPDQDVITFTAVEYIPPGLDETGSVAGERQSSKRQRLGTVTLPIQAQITDLNTAGWQEGNFDELFRRALNTAENLVLGDENTKKNLESQLSATTKEFITNKNQTLALIAESVFQVPVLGRTGSVVNPNVELLFTGPSLRDFSFSFRMSPRGKDEARDVKSIINFFKKNMAPKLSEGNLFLKAPNTFLLSYKGRGEQGLNKIKECALKGCDVNYTPQGSYMTYEDGTMVSYFMTLSFQEIEPIYSKDYEDNHPIGF